MISSFWLLPLIAADTLILADYVIDAMPFRFSFAIAATLRCAFADVSSPVGYAADIDIADTLRWLDIFALLIITPLLILLFHDIFRWYYAFFQIAFAIDDSFSLRCYFRLDWWHYYYHITDIFDWSIFS